MAKIKINLAGNLTKLSHNKAKINIFLDVESEDKPIEKVELKVLRIKPNGNERTDYFTVHDLYPDADEKRRMHRVITQEIQALYLTDKLLYVKASAFTVGGVCDSEIIHFTLINI